MYDPTKYKVSSCSLRRILQRERGIELTEEQAGKMMNDYYKLYPTIKQWHNRLKHDEK